MKFDINNRRYTGSKYKIRNWIKDIILKECKGAESFCDLFAGTSIMTYTLINKFKTFYINDFLFSNEIIYEAFYSKANFNKNKLQNFYNEFNNLNPDNLSENYISENYGNKYFSYDDSKIIGYIREKISDCETLLNRREKCILIASLVYSLDKCANTVGHYESYFKKKPISDKFRYELITPVILSSEDKREITISRVDSNELVKNIYPDIIYIDPPYSSRQYSRFYHVLENIVKWDKPTLHGVACKPEPENMSEYCKTKAIDFFRDLIRDINAKYIVVSYNNTYTSKSKSSKNKMTLQEIMDCLSLKGKTKKYSINHQAFNAGKTNLREHREYIFLTKVGVFDE